MIYVLAFCRRFHFKKLLPEDWQQVVQTPMFYFYSFLRSGILAQVTFCDGFDHEDARQRGEAALWENI